uniref:Uncharacterized protein n=1 Tax=Astyanax mexicanus TaxID=7994 RepID=A0A3B1JUD4_ASTMX
QDRYRRSAHRGERRPAIGIGPKNTDRFRRCKKEVNFGSASAILLLHSVSAVHFSKILCIHFFSMLMQKKLRSEDVKIFQQLQALNEGMECMRWLWEENIPQTSLSTNQSSQNPTFIATNQTISDLDQDHLQPPSLTTAEHDKGHGYETVVGQRSSSQSVVKPETQRMVLGQVESLGAHCIETPRLVTFQNKDQDQDPGLLRAGQLLGYDIHWRWVEHEDDVMFL